MDGRLFHETSCRFSFVLYKHHPQESGWLEFMTNQPVVDTWHAPVVCHHWFCRTCQAQWVTWLNLGPKQKVTAAEWCTEAVKDVAFLYPETPRTWLYGQLHCSAFPFSFKMVSYMQHIKVIYTYNTWFFFSQIFGNLKITFAMRHPSRFAAVSWQQFCSLNDRDTGSIPLKKEIG